MSTATSIRLRRGTSAEWTSANPVLNQGEPGLKTDTNKVKYGDGSHKWSELAYVTTGEPVLRPPKVVTGEYTLIAGDAGRAIFADATNGSFSINVLTAVGNTGPFIVRAIATNGNTVTLIPVSGQTIDKETSLLLGSETPPDVAVTLASDNANWHTI